MTIRDWTGNGGTESNALSGRLNVNEFLLVPFLLVLGHPIHLREQRVIPSHADIDPWVNNRPKLPDQDVARLDTLPVKDLDPSSLSVAVSPVSRGSPPLLMRHLGSRFPVYWLGLVRSP